MDLTPEEKQRIYFEEKARLEAKQRVKQEQVQAVDAAEGHKKRDTRLGCLVIFGLLFVIGLVFEKIETLRSSSSTKSESTSVILNAAVSFDEREFEVSNRDAFDWTNVKLEINYGLISSGYVLRVPRIAAGRTFTVGATEFTKSGGVRFNPRDIKAQKLSIFCDTPSGSGSYICGWE